MTMDDGTAVVTPIPASVLPGARWQPDVGPEARGVVERKLLGSAGEAVLDAAASILARGALPEEAHDPVTGLVVGVPRQRL